MRSLLRLLQTTVRMRQIYRLSLMLLLITTITIQARAATANGFTTVPPNTVNATLEGCRNDGSITFPSSATLPLICPTTAYTTGNLGKGWSELDLVPHRLTLKNGNSSGTITYNMIVAGDYTQGSTAIGYDVITPAVKNATLSDNNACSVADASGGYLTVSGVTGGTDTTIYRTLQITQPANSTCVFDFDMRLALGAHNFPGSSLQSYKFESANFSLGKATISIPVKEIQPQSISKTMTAVQGSDATWSISKTAPATLLIPNVCDASASLSKPATIVVTWTKTAVLGGIAITTTITATNPSSRVITINVTDKIYLGSSQTTLIDTSSSGDVDINPNTSTTVLVHTFTDSANADATSYNDVATATYTDKLTGVAIPGTTTASKSANVTQGSSNNGSATITDVESVTGNISFSLDTFSPAIGSVTDPSGYSLGDGGKTSLTWATGTNAVTDDGSVTFNKTVTYGSTAVGTATLDDTATLVASGGFTTDSGKQTIAISAEAKVSLTISKTINPFDTGTITFHVFDSTAAEVATPQITFSALDPTTKTVTVNNLQPDTYTVTEDAIAGWSTSVSGSPIDLTASSQSTCAGTVSFTNTKAAHIIVKKVTNPSPDPTSASFPFTSNYRSAFSLVNGGSNDSGALAPGSYNVTEGTVPTGWKLTGIGCVTTGGNNSSATTSLATSKATITLYAGDTVTCTYTNATSRTKVIKTFNGGAIPAGTSFTFQLRSGASASAAGSILESRTFDSSTASTGILFSTLLVPGNTYQMCEQMLPGYLTTLGPPLYSVYNPSGDNSIVCTDFTAVAGDTKTFTINNQPPPGGMALTIGFWKNWSSCGSNGKQKPVLDQTLAKFASGLVVSATSGTYEVFGATYWLKLSTCSAAVNLLNKSTLSGQKTASDPAFNLAAQLVAAELNFKAGAGAPSSAISAVNSAVLLLGKYHFDGNTHTKISSADANTMNNLANTLNNYNNNI